MHKRNTDPPKDHIEAVPFVLESDIPIKSQSFLHSESKVKKHIHLKLHSDVKDPRDFTIKKKNSRKNVELLIG